MYEYDSRDADISVGNVSYGHKRASPAGSQGEAGAPPPSGLPLPPRREYYHGLRQTSWLRSKKDGNKKHHNSPVLALPRRGHVTRVAVRMYRGDVFFQVSFFSLGKSVGVGTCAKRALRGVFFLEIIRHLHQRAAVAQPDHEPPLSARYVCFQTLITLFLGWYSNIRVGWGSYSVPAALQVRER